MYLKTHCKGNLLWLSIVAKIVGPAKASNYVRGIGLRGTYKYFEPTV
jgi:hypothetical protein